METVIHPNKGVFTISLDLELYWGVHDTRSLSDYKTNLLGARKAIPQILALFQAYDIHATWATVGFLFCQNKQQLQQVSPTLQPTYDNPALSPFSKIAGIGEEEASDPFHYAASWIKKIQETPHQEIGTHTFSHYYCLEKGQSAKEFEADIAAAKKVAELADIQLKSIVFPRNQCNESYLEICEKAGIETYRGTEKSYFYTARNRSDESLVRRAGRLADAYVRLSGYNSCSMAEIAEKKPFNIRASRFLRPHSPKLAFLDPLRLQRIRQGMTYTAQQKRVYHLWWHPHNFGVFTNKNILFLEKILKHYQFLQKKYGMKSLNMKEIGVLVST